jgi:hypothetical protein
MNDVASFGIALYAVVGVMGLIMTAAWYISGAVADQATRRANEAEAETKRMEANLTAEIWARGGDPAKVRVVLDQLYRNLDAHMPSRIVKLAPGRCVISDKDVSSDLPRAEGGNDE